MAEKFITLALQGGGSHGAFTWGVLERLLDEKRLAVEGISGTSAGAINAAMFVDGYEKGGREGAKAALKSFWEAISHHGAFSPYHTGPFNPPGAKWSPFAIWFDLLSQTFSPYQINPFNFNPLRDLLNERIDFGELRSCRKIKLFISATNVNTNHLHIFTNNQITLDVLLASTCLPYMHHAVKIGGEYYWDGGFMGNPVIEPLIRRCATSDTLIVQINPTQKPGLPWHAVEIADRINEITFNSNLMREIQSYMDVTRLIEKGYISDPRIERAYFHAVQMPEKLGYLGVRSKLDTSWIFLNQLRSDGNEVAGKWLERHYDDIGKKTTLDMSVWSPHGTGL